MTRFKELTRIEAAIEHVNESELRWADSYCRMRLGIAVRKEHVKYWQGIERKVAAALRELTNRQADPQ